LKILDWIGSSKKDLLKLPEEIIQTFGFGLYQAQMGNRHIKSKTLKGFSGANVIEILEDDSSGTYRAVYTIKFKDIVYVLHVFQKKSKQGIKTPKDDMDLIKSRLKLAQEMYNERVKNEKK